jgi:hypothetical protein
LGEITALAPKEATMRELATVVPTEHDVKYAIQSTRSALQQKTSESAYHISSVTGISAFSLYPGNPMPFAPAPGDTMEIEPGCSHTKDTCYAKFNNIAQFAGEAEIPGLNVLAAGTHTQVPTY